MTEARHSTRALVRIVKALVHPDKPRLTMAMVAELGGVSESTARLYVKELRAARLVRVGGWEASPAAPNVLRPLYSWGGGRDASRPGKLTGAERTARYRDRKDSAKQLLLHLAAPRAEAAPQPAHAANAQLPLLTG